jgi:hypothetical protein
MPASMLFNSICIKVMIGSRPGFNPRYRRNFFVEIFHDLSTLKDFNWSVSMVRNDLKDNRSPGTVAYSVIPQLGRLALWMIDWLSSKAINAM